MTQQPNPPLGGDEAKAGRIELTSASEVLALLSSDDHVIRLLTKAGVSDSIRIEAAYALIAQRKQAVLAAPVLPVEVREAITEWAGLVNGRMATHGGGLISDRDLAGLWSRLSAIKGDA